MPQPPYALLRASINGGANQTGGLVIAGSSTVQLSADPAGNASRFLWQIYGYPVGFTQPSGWSTAADGTYYSSAATPPPFTVGAISLFGKYMLRLTVNNGGTDGQAGIDPRDLVDESTAIEVISNSGIHSTGLNETTQWGGLKQWIAHVNINWVLINAWINGGGGGGGGVTVHGALTGLSVDDHTQYLLVNGTRAMGAALSMGGFKITGLATPAVGTDAATKAYVDSVVSTVTGVIKADGTIPFTADQSLGSHKLTSLATPTASTDAATKAYVDATILPSGVNPFTGAQSMGGFKLTSVGTPTAAGDATTKAYVDAMVGAAPVARLATAAALPSNTRTGNVLTASANAALTVDGTAVAVADIVLVKNEATGANDGLFSVTATGSGAAPFVLTRTSNILFSGMAVAIVTGTANGGKLALLKTEGAIVVNTTTLDFQIASGAAGANGTDGANGANGTNGADAFNAIPSASLLTGATQTIAPGIPGVKFTLAAGSQSANAVLTMVAGSGLRAFDTVFVEVFDVSAFTYTIRNGGATPADMVVKPASPGCKRIYSFQWDGADFFVCNAVAVV